MFFIFMGLKMKNRVDFQEDISDSIKRIPFLKKFCWDKGVIVPHSGCCPFFDSFKINKYMGYNWTDGRELTSQGMNEILSEAERRGDT